LLFEKLTNHVTVKAKTVLSHWGYWTLLPGVAAWWSDVTGQRYSCRCWLGLLDIILKDATLVSLAILGLGSGGRLGCGSLGEES